MKHAVDQRALELSLRHMQTDKERTEAAGKRAQIEGEFAINQLKLNEQLKAAQDGLTQKIIEGTVASVEAQNAEEDATEAALLNISKEQKARDDALEAAGRAGEVALAEFNERMGELESRMQGEFDAAKIQKTMDNIRSVTEPIFESLSRAISGTVTGILQGTLTVQQAFRNMGQNIAASLIESVINRGLNLVQKALEDFIADLVRSGLIKQLIGLGVNLATSLFAPSAPTAPSFSPAPTASGGIFTSPQMRLIGEAGPEAVIPLDKLGGGMTVIINNNTGEPVEQRDRRGPNGQLIKEIIIGTFNRYVGDGGADGLFGRTYGLQRVPQGR
jgi:hypothetical protein